MHAKTHRLGKFAPLLLLATLTFLLTACPGISDNGGGNGGAPQISSFTPSQNNVASGTPVTLNWVITGVPTSLSISGSDGTSLSSLIGTNTTVTPTTTTTYTLTATNSSGSDTETTTVTVGGTVTPPPPGGSRTLSFGVSLSQTGPFTSDADGGITAGDPRIVNVPASGGTFYAQVTYSGPAPVNGVTIFIANRSPAGLLSDLSQDTNVKGFTLQAETTGCALDGTQTSVTCIYPITVAAGTPNITALPNVSGEFAYVFRTRVSDTTGFTYDQPPRGYVTVGGSSTPPSDPNPPTEPPTPPSPPTPPNPPSPPAPPAPPAPNPPNPPNPPTTYTFTVKKAGNGSGTVTGTGINCGTDCTETYSSSTDVTLTATATEGSDFDGWSGGGCSGTGRCQVTVNAAKTVTATFSLEETSEPEELNAEAGSGTRTGTVGTAVPLNGSASTGATTYNWSLVVPTGSSATISGVTRARASFTPDVAGLYVATLTVGDGTDTDTDTVRINVTNSTPAAPEADAGDPRRVDVSEGQTATLDGSDSSSNAVTFSWEITSRPSGGTLTITDPNNEIASFTPTVPGPYVATLTVSNGATPPLTDTDTVTITAIE